MMLTNVIFDKRDGKAKISTSDDQHFRSLEKTVVFFNGRIYPPNLDSSGNEIIAKQLLDADPYSFGETFLKEVEGDFSLIIAESKRIIAGRDPIGVQPFYYGENKSIAALASNRKELWNLGIQEVHSFPPGHLSLVNREGFKFKQIKTLHCSVQKQVTMQEAVETLAKLLERSVSKRVSGSKDVAVAFSGGLDSSIIAFLAKKCSVNVHLVHVSLENQPEIEEAKKAAYALDLPLYVYLFREEEVERVISNVVELIEEADPIKASIGIPFYWVAEKTAELSFKVLLAGQGADELFGGYQRYVNEYLLYGKEKATKTMFDDVIGIHESNLERDMKICYFHKVELRLPFGSYPIAKFAMNLPIELKIERCADTQRKLVLRKAAEKIGLPSIITNKPKKAVQYSTGVSNALKKIAKKQKKTMAEYVKELFLSRVPKN